MAEGLMMPIADVPDLVEQRCGWKPSLATVRDWLDGGKILGRKIGGRVFIDPVSVRELFDGKERSDQ